MENNIRDLQKVKCKKYIEMNEDEKKLAVNFIKLNNKQGTSIKDLDDMFCGKIYDKGKGVLFYFYKEVVLAKIAVVLECIKPLGNSFIHGIEVIPELRDSYEFLKDMIQEAKKLAIDCGAETVKLGVRNEEILRALEIKGINKSYSAIKMKLNDRIIREKTLNLEELTKENSKRYQEVYNDSFSDMPHGTWLDNEGLNECLNNKNNDKYYFMVKDNNEIIGFMNAEIENNKGMFDIGLCKRYRNKGFGKKLLETAIKFLNDKGVDKIELIVIEKNKIAHNMYKKRGFIKENTISEWIEL